MNLKELEELFKPPKKLFSDLKPGDKFRFLSIEVIDKSHLRHHQYHYVVIENINSYNIQDTCEYHDGAKCQYFMRTFYNDAEYVKIELL